MKLPLSVIIPTKNEEANIDKCLDRLSWADQIFVVDSNSIDRTQQIAARRAAKVVPFQWDGTGPRKLNWSLANLCFKHDWVMVVDADEEPSNTLPHELTARVLSGKEKHAGYLVPYNYYFLGRLLRHGAPLYKLIIFRATQTRYERREVPGLDSYDLEMHCHPMVAGTIGCLRSPMIHRDHEDLHHHFARHNVYSDWEALLRTRYKQRDLSQEIAARALGSWVERRRFAKQCFLRLPAKSFCYFLYSYVLRGGFLDGRPGFIYNVLKSFYWYQISIKAYELMLTASNAQKHTAGTEKKADGLIDSERS
jgi:glycosyltransferase involved in cell wall biosynthesis